jgi:hypothetical protein
VDSLIAGRGNHQKSPLNHRVVAPVQPLIFPFMRNAAPLCGPPGDKSAPAPVTNKSGSLRQSLYRPQPRQPIDFPNQINRIGFHKI